MLTQALTLPEDPEELRSFTARLLAEVKAQAILIEKLRHQLAGHRAHRFGASSETAEQLQLALETSEIAAAAMTARMKLPDIEEKDKPKRRPIPDHIPRKASLALSDRIGRQVVSCQETDIDRYGRSVADCFAGGENLNRWMVREGWAVAYRQYSTAYVAAEEHARTGQRGI